VTGNSSDQDLSFIDPMNAYRPYGGVSRVNDLPAALRVTCAGQDQSVSDLVCNGDLFAFSWHDDLWIPMFQFDSPGLVVDSTDRIRNENHRHKKTFAESCSVFCERQLLRDFKVG
jgi:hypothetical protein